MTHLKRAGAAALVAVTLALGASAATISAHAAPAVGNAANSQISANSGITTVEDHYRHGNRHWRDRHHRNGFRDVAPYIGLGIAGAIIEGAINEDAADYDESPVYSDGSSAAMQRCAATFRSFEWDTGLYTTYEGDKRLCPFLG
jgi:hypothetical protein